MQKYNTSLVAHNEHITDDVEEMFPQLDEATRDKIVNMIEIYIAAAIETVIDNPDWFEEDEA